MKVKKADSFKKKSKKLKGIIKDIDFKQDIREFKTKIINVEELEPKKPKKLKKAKSNAFPTEENVEIEIIHVDENKELSAVEEGDIPKLKKKKKNSENNIKHNVKSRKEHIKTTKKSKIEKCNQNGSIISDQLLIVNKSTSKKNKKSEINIANEDDMEVDINQLPSEDSESEDDNELKSKAALQNQNEAREKVKSRKQFFVNLVYYFIYI